VNFRKHRINLAILNYLFEKMANPEIKKIFERWVEG